MSEAPVDLACELLVQSLAAWRVAGIEAIYGGTQVAAVTQQEVSAPSTSTSSSGVGGGGGGCSLDRSGRPATLADLFWSATLIAVIALRRTVPKAA